MHILITGGSGFIGTHLTRALAAAGHQATILSRSSRSSPHRNLTYLAWNGRELPLGIGLYDAVINLAGAGIADQRWTDAYKQEILRSRQDATRACVEYINRSPRPPSVFLSASGVGYYGVEHSAPVDEQSTPGSDFAAEVCKVWEAEAQQARCRTVQMRIGVVLGKDGGALAKMVPIYRAFMGGRFASGKQGFPWIHLDDLIRFMLEALDSPAYAGPVNLAAPQQVSQAVFSRTLARTLGVPELAAVPKFGLDLLFGEQSVLFWGGQYMQPRVLEQAGFQWQYPELEGALRSLFPR
jgi:hypothetical protein